MRGKNIRAYLVFAHVVENFQISKEKLRKRKKERENYNGTLIATTHRSITLMRYAHSKTLFVKSNTFTFRNVVVQMFTPHVGSQPLLQDRLFAVS